MRTTKIRAEITRQTKECNGKYVDKLSVQKQGAKENRESKHRGKHTQKTATAVLGEEGLAFNNRRTKHLRDRWCAGLPLSYEAIVLIPFPNQIYYIIYSTKFSSALNSTAVLFLWFSNGYLLRCLICCSALSIARPRQTTSLSAIIYSRRWQKTMYSYGR